MLILWAVLTVVGMTAVVLIPTEPGSTAALLVGSSPVFILAGAAPLAWWIVFRLLSPMDG